VSCIVPTGRLAGYQYFLAGAGVGAIATFLSTPFEMVKVQLQLDNVALKQYVFLPLNERTKKKERRRTKRKKTTTMMVMTKRAKEKSERRRQF
jgi:hypothetical protein